MVREPRQRHYVSRFTLLLVRPLFRHSQSRDAYVMRGIGNSFGPVLRRERRRRQREFGGAERRHLALG
jgi:hypothetical protein